MGYYDAEVFVQDVNPANADIFNEGWLYVAAPKHKKAPLYFAPYFTPNIGISMISRVIDDKTAKLDEHEETVTEIRAPSEEHFRRWRRGFVLVRELYEDSRLRILFLDQPLNFRTTPLTKTMSEDAGMSKQIPSQISPGFSLRFDDLLRTMSMPPAP